jgi:hypothetical protein
VAGSNILAALLVAIWLCAGGGAPLPDDQNNDIGQASIPAYAGFPEQVTIPTSAKAGEDIPISIELSAAQRPELLAGDLHARWIRVFYPMYQNGEVIGFEIDLWFGPEKHGDIPISRLESSIPGMPAGEWLIRLRSPASRQEGGTFGRYFITPTSARPSSIQYVYTDYMISVVP